MERDSLSREASSRARAIAASRAARAWWDTADRLEPGSDLAFESRRRSGADPGRVPGLAPPRAEAYRSAGSLWEHGPDGESAGWPRSGGGVDPSPGSRKVGTPQGRVLASGQSGRPAGKCHRKQTADGGPRGRTGKGETVR